MQLPETTKLTLNERNSYRSRSDSGYSLYHAPQVVSLEDTFGSQSLKYFPWIPMSPFLYGYQRVPVSLSYRTKVLR